jgi:cytochrome P450
MCVAKKLAMMEMKMIVCLVLHNFDLRFADAWNPQEWEQRIGDYFTATRGPMPVVLTPRAQSVA